MVTQQTPSASFGMNALRSRRSWLPIGIILAIATCLFTYRLGHEGVWIDELFSIRDASAYDSPLEIYRASRLRPLYYILLSFWMRFGSSDIWLRSLSVIISIVSVFLIYKLGKKLAGETEGLVAAALLMTSPLFINHTQEIRMYALSLCMCLAGSIFLAEALLTQRTDKPSQKVLAGWAAFRLLAICTVPLNLTLLIPDALLILLRFRREPKVLLSFTLWTIAIFVLWSPAIAPLLRDASPDSAYATERTEFSEPPGLGNLVYPLKFWMVWPFVTNLGTVAHKFYQLFTLVVAGLVGAGLIYKRRAAALPWALLWFALPLIPIIAFSLSVARIWEPRYVLFVSPYLFILIAAGITRLWKEWKTAGIVLTAVYVLGVGVALTHYYTIQNRADVRANVETIEQYEQPGDALVWSYGWGELTLDRYYDGTSDVYQQSGRDLETAADVRAWIDEFPTDYERVWLAVEKMDFITKPMEGSDSTFEDVINDNYEIAQVFDDYAHDSAVFLLTPIKTASTN